MKINLLLTIFVSILISVFVFVAGSYFMGSFENKKIAEVNLNDEYTIVAGVIRNGGDGWGLIQDATHETIGIKEITQTDEKIIITYDANTKVNSLSATVDEAMASEGYTVGASVGVDQTWLFIYDDLHNLVNPADYVNQSGNIWVHGIFKK